MLADSSFTLAKINRIIRASMLLSCLLAGAAHAQQGGGIVTLGTAAGAPATSVIVAFNFDNTDDADVLEARARIQGIDAFSEVDASNLCDSSAALIVSCQLNDTNRLVVTATNLAGTPIASFSGSVEFTVAPDTPGGTKVVLEWDAPQDQDLTFTPSDSNNGLVSVITDGPQVSLAPDSLDFGSIEVGMSSDNQTIQVTNSGNADGLEIGAASTATPSFTVTNDGCDQAVLARDESCAIDVSFAPTSDGALADELSVPTSVGTASAPLTGTGTAARLSASPPPGTVDFGVVAVGDSTGINGQFTNEGSAPLDIACTLSPGDGDFQTEPAPLSINDIAPAASADFTLTFAPATGAEQTATLTCQTNAIDTPEFQYLLTAPGTFIFSDRFEP